MALLSSVTNKLTKKMVYMTTGTCAQAIDLDVQDGIVKHLQFYGGCNGNTQGVCRLAEGMPVEEIIKRLKGIRCGNKPTSCPDQLATALEQMLQSK